MFGLILEMFTYPFMVRALCMGVLVAVCLPTRLWCGLSAWASWWQSALRF